MTQQRKEDILKIISTLDISPTMYMAAVEKYQHLATFLQEYGVECNIYPQGSFALGTVVRPNAKDPDAGYDLDFVCQIQSSKNNVSPKTLWDEVEQALKSNEIYRKRLEVFDKCLTIHYADIGNIPFSIDIVPAVDESLETKTNLVNQSNRPDLIQTSIAIPQRPQYNWITNNPKGYCKWFADINAPFLEYGRIEFRKSLFRANQGIYNKIEDIPTELERSSVQRVIQILKRHRDYHYARMKDGDELKPISAIISTFVARIAAVCSPDITIYELLEGVLNEFALYANLNLDVTDSFSVKFPGKTLIMKEGDTWRMNNPSNPGDNLMDAWNNNALIPTRFFSWIRTAQTDLILSLKLEDSQFRSLTENAFGKDIVHSVLGDKYSKLMPRPISPQTNAKPWKK